jgi:archaellum component FlaC
MSEVKASLDQIHQEIKELRELYKRLLDRLVPIDEPTEEEKRAIEESDEIAGEEELRKALGLRDRD